jgi:DNA-binding NarL/FixJ family response regulator
VVGGKIYASPGVMQRIMKSIRNPSGNGSFIDALSDRELAVFERIGKGAGTAKIAEVMSLSIKTIETYRARIKSKLNINSSAELAQRAVQWVLEKG